jgi:hypothetical protein
VGITIKPVIPTYAPFDHTPAGVKWSACKRTHLINFEKYLNPPLRGNPQPSIQIAEILKVSASSYDWKILHQTLQKTNDPGRDVVSSLRNDPNPSLTTF